jgi:hypothetical protein
MRRVPVRDVPTRIAHDRDVVEEARHEVHHFWSTCMPRSTAIWQRSASRASHQRRRARSSRRAAPRSRGCRCRLAGCRSRSARVRRREAAP